jgi:hypothetical protein
LDGRVSRSAAACSALAGQYSKKRNICLLLRQVRAIVFPKRRSTSRGWTKRSNPARLVGWKSCRKPLKSLKTAMAIAQIGRRRLSLKKIQHVVARDAVAREWDRI